MNGASVSRSCLLPCTQRQRWHESPLDFIRGIETSVRLSEAVGSQHICMPANTLAFGMRWLMVPLCLRIGGERKTCLSPSSINIVLTCYASFIKQRRVMHFRLYTPVVAALLGIRTAIVFRTLLMTAPSRP